MQQVTLFLAVIVSACLFCAVHGKGPKFDQLEGYSFEQYKKDFSKVYPLGSEEHAMRQKLFTQRLINIQAHNTDSTRTYNQGVNHLTDWTVAEREQIMGNRPHMKANLKQSPHMKVRELSPTATLPKTVDYRKASPAVLTAVKDQGQCGSCWAHAAAESIESMMAIATGDLFVLSQQQITSCTPNPRQCGGTGGCAGAIVELAWDHVAAVGGIQQEWTYPYTSYFGNSSFDSCEAKLNKGKKVVKVSGYTKAVRNDATSVAETLASAGPLAISVDASHWFEYSDGVFNGCDFAKNISMDHAVQLVGYGHDTLLKMDYWIVRNSWSGSWGEEGFIRLNKPEKTRCGWNVDNRQGAGCKGGPNTSWVCGTCGIVWDAVYPNVF